MNFGLRSLSFSAVPLSLFMTAAYYISSPSARNGDFVILYVIYSSGPHRAYPLIFYVHICSSQIVFLSNFRCVITAHTAKCFLMLSYPITPAINTFLDISSIFLHIFIQTGSLNKISCIFFRISPAHIYTPHSPPSTSKC